MGVEVTLKTKDRPAGVVGSNQNNILSDTSGGGGVPTFSNALFMFVTRANADGTLDFSGSQGFGTGPSGADSICGVEYAGFPIVSFNTRWYGLVWTSTKSLASRMSDDGYMMAPVITRDVPGGSVDFKFNRDVFALTSGLVQNPQLIIRSGQPYLSEMITSGVLLRNYDSTPFDMGNAWVGEGCNDWVDGSAISNGMSIGAAMGPYFNSATLGCADIAKVICIGVPVP